MASLTVDSLAPRFLWKRQIDSSDAKHSSIKHHQNRPTFSTEGGDYNALSVCLEATPEQNRDPHTTSIFVGAQNPNPKQGTIMITPLIILGPKSIHRKNTSFSRRGVYGPGLRPCTSSICRWNLRSHNMQQSQTSNSCGLFPFCQITQALLLLPALRWRASVQRVLCSDISLRQTRFGSFLLKIARTP